MKLNIAVFLSIILLTFCTQDKKANSDKLLKSKRTTDTILVKKIRIEYSSYGKSVYSKTYSYHWVAGLDTLDLKVVASQYKSDSSLHIAVIHEKPTLFKNLLSKVEECIALIKTDFDITKLNSLYFRSPIYYVDLAKELSRDYEQNFGRKYPGYQKLQIFLLKSALTKQLEMLLQPYNKKVERYGLEK